MSVFGVILVRIFPHKDWIKRDTPHLSVFSPNTWKIRTRITPNTDTFHAVGNGTLNNWISLRTQKQQEQKQTSLFTPPGFPYTNNLIIYWIQHHMSPHFFVWFRFEVNLISNKSLYRFQSRYSIEALIHHTAQKMKLSVKDFFCKCE